MLINSVILLLRDALPIFVLISLLWTQLSFNRCWLPLSFILGLIVTVLLVEQLNLVGNWFAGAGVELLMFFIQVINYFLILILAYQLAKKLPNKNILIFTAGSMLVLTMANRGTNLVVYFSGYFYQLDALQPMIIGAFLGLGICLSLMILLYFSIRWLDSKFGQVASILFILIYTVGQLTNALPLLVQVDVLNGSEAAWNTQHILTNQSEAGQFFNVLFGYQATPSLHQVVLYICSLSAAFILFWRIKTLTTKQGRNP